MAQENITIKLDLDTAGFEQAVRELIKVMEINVKKEP